MRTFSELKCPLANVYLYINYLSFIETQLTYKFVSVSVVVIQYFCRFYPILDDWKIMGVTPHAVQ